MLSTRLATVAMPAVSAGTPGPGESKISASMSIFSSGRYAMMAPSACGLSRIRCNSIVRVTQMLRDNMTKEDIVRVLESDEYGWQEGGRASTNSIDGIIDELRPE